MSPGVSKPATLTTTVQWPVHRQPEPRRLWSGAIRSGAQPEGIARQVAASQAMRECGYRLGELAGSRHSVVNTANRYLPPLLKKVKVQRFLLLPRLPDGRYPRKSGEILQIEPSRDFTSVNKTYLIVPLYSVGRWCMTVQAAWAVIYYAESFQAASGRQERALTSQRTSVRCRKEQAQPGQRRLGKG